MQRTLLRTWLQYVVRQWQLCLLTVVAAPRRCTGGSARWTAARTARETLRAYIAPASACCCS